MKALILLAVCWGWLRLAPAQSSISAQFVSRTWTIAEGLPNNSVHCVLQTRDRFLWVGTGAGLARFDGLSFRKTQFPSVPDSNVSVTALCEDQEGRLFIGTAQHGLFCYQESRLERLGPRRLSVTSLTLGQQGELWVGSREGLAKWQRGTLQSFGPKDGLPGTKVIHVFAGSSGNIWVTFASGIYLLANGKATAQFLREESPGSAHELLGVYEDQQKELWAFADTCMIKLPEGKRWHYFRGGYIPSVRVQSFLGGKNGRIWIGANGQGFFEVMAQEFEHIEMRTQEGLSEVLTKRVQPIEIKSGREPSDVRAICEDYAGNLWLGTDKSGLVRLRRDSLRLVGVAEGLPSRPALCIAEYPQDKLLICYADGTFFTGPPAARLSHIVCPIQRMRLGCFVG